MGASGMLRYLGIDYGTRRIGLAMGDDATRIASPLDAIQAGGGDAAAVQRILDRIEPYEIDAFVIGLPLNMDGTEGEQARLTRAFGDALASGSGKPVHYFDERLSSAAAEELLESTDLSSGRRKTRIDAVAAQVMLQGFLEARG